MRKLSCVAPGWWDYTTIDQAIVQDAARLTPHDLEQLSRPGFRVVMYDTIEEFYLAEALEYIEAWKQSTPDNPAGICGPIGPTEQLPLVARLVNAMDLPLGKLDAHFWGMDEWVLDGKAVGMDHPLSFAKADLEMCFLRIRKELQMPASNLHFPTGDLAAYSKSYDQVRCLLMQGGQGDVKHWAFNDPVRREGKYVDAPPTPAEYRQLRHANCRSASDDRDAERADLGRRQHVARADPSRHGRAGGDLEGREGLDLAGRLPRQSVRHATDDADDLQALARFGRADEPVGRSSAGAVQLLPSRTGHVRRGNALGDP